jgi:hypothetical protein
MECLECAVTIPAYPAKCSRLILPGGIKGFVLAKCGQTDFTDITDLDEWQTKITAGTVTASAMRRVLGNEPEAEEAVAKLGSCDPDELLSLRHTLDILDHNSEDPTIGFKQDAFYNWLNNNYQKLSLGYVTCDDRFYGFITSFGVIAKRAIENNNFDGKTFWHAVFKWDKRDHTVPVLIPGLGDLFENPA